MNKDDDSPSERNTARAFQCFQSASEQGHKAAHYYLGLLHKMKKIEAPNPKAAFHHFTVAANEHDESDETGHGSKTINETLKRQSQYEGMYSVTVWYQFCDCIQMWLYIEWMHT